MKRALQNLQISGILVRKPYTERDLAGAIAEVFAAGRVTGPRSAASIGSWSIVRSASMLWCIFRRYKLTTAMAA